MTSPCKKSNLKFKLGLRLVIFNEKEIIIDGLTGEVTKRATKKKLYDGKLKSVLATKCHLSNFLKSVPFIFSTSIKKVDVPSIQIMGLDVHVYLLKMYFRFAFQPCKRI